MSKEIIEEIKDCSFRINQNDSLYDDVYEGFIVKTNKQEIKFGIEAGQSCCENWGYFISEDNLKDFINSELIEIKLVDTALKTYEEIEGFCEGEIMFVNFETSKGTLQFVAYNEHNGYYGHEAIIISNQLTKRECL